MKSWPLLLLVGSFGPFVFFACSAVEQPNIGSFGGLKSTPVPTVVNPNAVCVASNYIAKAGDTCAVSFKTDIFPRLVATGSWGCGKSGCHEYLAGQEAPYGFGLGANKPTPESAYGAMAAGSSLPKAVINPCTKDINSSYLYCNIGGTGVAQCGTPMPLGARPDATSAPPEGADKLKTWLECGSPNN
jgi:hypothetical protein